MKLVSQKEQQEYQNATVRGFATWGAGGLVGSTAASYLAQQRWTNYRTQLTPALKALPVVAATIFFGVVGADRYGVSYEEARYDVGKINQEEQLEHRLGIDGKGKGVDSNALSVKDQAIEYVKTHRYQAVAGAWAASMVGSFAYIASSPLSFAQKLVQARMWAQASTVAVLLASAGLATIPTAAGNDAERREYQTRQDSLYKWKKDSPHELERRKHLNPTQPSVPVSS